MDESLSEFQEKRKNNTGPKNLKKTRPNIKLPKRARGQKDIRSLIRKEDSNSIVSYSKDFDKVCKKTGVDVDSEQLQLAIALSKSLHDAGSVASCEPQSFKPLTSQERISNIKNTLQGYGFHIRKSQITTATLKKKRYKKQYKLILASQIERQQNISDKYAEVLAANIFKSPVNLEQCGNYGKGLYYNTTHIAYENLKNDDVYYVKDLFVRSCNKICLLKDWSDIPGRPVSPTVEVSDINFEGMTFTQQELDCILSGTIYTAQLIISNKSIALHGNDHIKSKAENSKCEFTQINLNIKSPKGDNLFIKKQCNLKTMSNSHFRCISPDIFDDEVSVVLEVSNNGKQPLEETVLRGDFNQSYCMDLTKCVNVMSVDPCTYIKTSQDSKHYRPFDIKKTSKSSDLMEITKCVTSSSDQENVNNIDLTQPKGYLNLETDNSAIQNKIIDIMDLTQIANHDLTESGANGKNKVTCTVVVLDEKSNFNQQYNEDSSKQHSYSAKFDHCKNPNCSREISSEENLFNNCKSDETIILDEENQENCSSMHVGRNLQKPHNRSSDNINKPLYSMCCEYEKQVFENECERNEVANVFDVGQSEEIDLTQSSGSSEGVNECNKLPNLQTEYIASLGKKDNISIDYDDIFDDIVRESKSQNSIKSLECNDDSNESNNSNTSLQIGKRLEVFDISDNELKYSLHHSKYEKLKGGHCNSENNPTLGVSYNINTEDTPVIECNMATNNINAMITLDRETPQSQKNNFDKHSSTPTKESRINIKSILNTPTNCKYIIKTSDVTPMLDYATMASPERNKELEKYGLKPFKRKRAIQILTHIYTQTHPMVDSYIDISSSPKRQKRDDEILNNSPQKITSPKPVDCILEVDKENNIYTVTKEQPDIKNIVCAPEDWVFQKREKAKIHSCRVPLHIAFHNYVSCRHRLREAILCYKPVNFELIHKDLVATGYRYNPKDLLRFMDKKCITVRTADNNQRNRKS